MIGVYVCDVSLDFTMMFLLSNMKIKDQVLVKALGVSALDPPGGTLILLKKKKRKEKRGIMDHSNQPR